MGTVVVVVVAAVVAGQGAAAKVVAGSVVVRWAEVALVAVAREAAVLVVAPVAGVKEEAGRLVTEAKAVGRKEETGWLGAVRTVEGQVGLEGTKEEMEPLEAVTLVAEGRALVGVELAVGAA